MSAWARPVAQAVNRTDETLGSHRADVLAGTGGHCEFPRLSSAGIRPVTVWGQCPTRCWWGGGRPHQHHPPAARSSSLRGENNHRCPQTWPGVP